MEEARENPIDAVRMMRQPVDLSKLPRNKIVIEQLEWKRLKPSIAEVLKRFKLSEAIERLERLKWERDRSDDWNRIASFLTF